MPLSSFTALSEPFEDSGYNFKKKAQLIILIILNRDIYMAKYWQLLVTIFLKNQVYVLQLGKKIRQVSAPK